MPDSGQLRTQRWRDRQAGKLPPAEPPLICAACGSNHTGRHGILCSRCWTRLTAEGTADRRARVNRARAQKAAAVEPCLETRPIRMMDRVQLATIETVYGSCPPLAVDVQAETSY